nr:restriction endonuclease subunit S [Mycoplasma haemofelis]
MSSSFRPFLREAENVKYLKLGEICSIVLNGTRFGFEFYKDSGFPVLKEKNIQHGQIVTEDLSYCDPEKHPKANVIKYGDVVVSSSGRVGINLIDRDFFFISTIYKFVPHTWVLTSRYLYHFLLSHPQKIKGLIKDGRIRKLDLEELIIPVPPLEIQERIANVLDKNRSQVGRIHAVKITNDNPYKKPETSKRKSFLRSLKSLFWQGL